jgi:hypothetical protein
MNRAAKWISFAAVATVISAIGFAGLIVHESPINETPQEGALRTIHTAQQTGAEEHSDKGLHLYFQNWGPILAKR